MFYLLIWRYLKTYLHVKCSLASAWKIKSGIWVRHVNGPFSKSSNAQSLKLIDALYDEDVSKLALYLFYPTCGNWWVKIYLDK